MNLSETYALFHLINWATQQVPVGGQKPQSIRNAERVFHAATGRWPRTLTNKTFDAMQAAEAAERQGE